MHAVTLRSFVPGQGLLKQLCFWQCHKKDVDKGHIFVYGSALPSISVEMNCGWILSAIAYKRQFLVVLIVAVGD